MSRYTHTHKWGEPVRTRGHKGRCVQGQGGVGRTFANRESVRQAQDADTAERADTTAWPRERLRIAHCQLAVPPLPALG